MVKSFDEFVNESKNVPGIIIKNKNKSDLENLATTTMVFNTKEKMLKREKELTAKYDTVVRGDVLGEDTDCITVTWYVK